MIIAVPINSAISPTQKTQIPVEIPEPLENSAGRVEISAQGWPHLAVLPDAAMQSAGFLWIKDAGQVEMLRGEEVLRVTTNKGRSGLILASRPDLRALIENREEIARAIDATRERYWRQEREQTDGPLVAAMNAQVDALLAALPPGHVRVTVTKTGDLDGDPIYRYEAEGVELAWNTPEMVHHGTPAAIRPRALSAFASVLVMSIPRAKLSQLRVEQDQKRAAAAYAVNAHVRELAETPVPPSAVAAYQHYWGDADRAWEQGDEAAWAEIGHWAPYIEAQGLAPGVSTAAAVREAHQAARESALPEH